MPFKTHLSVLAEAAASLPDQPVFRVPILVAPDADEVAEWTSISYSQFNMDVDAYAKYWLRTLGANGLVPHDIVGLW